ncbi:MAG TPA: 50S ribosomal protein L6, partial [Actinobacteria bacterium]|nr:50S ribosomal protein L6 [Actinomycetota bacterium]
MSRIGKQPIPVPAGVEVTIEGTDVTVKGPKGVLSQSFDPDMQITLEDGAVLVRRPTDG